MAIREIRTGSTSVASIEDAEVAQMTGELEMAAAGVRAADLRLTLAVQRAVVEAGATWADVCHALWGTRDRVWVDRCRAQYREAVTDYRAGVPVVLPEDLAPVVRRLLG